MGATAYEALQVVKQSRGDAVLKNLVEVRGETGQPQPQSWTILMSDASARGGVREFVVTGGEIASERTPVRGVADARQSTALDFARLNLDSDGAFKLANKAASEAKVGFHSVDYTLRTNSADGAPQWQLRLSDYMGAPVGDLEISAESGKVVQTLQIDPDSRQPIAETEATTTETTKAPREKTPTRFKGGVFGFVERTARDIGTTTKDVSLKVGSTVKKTTLNAVGSMQEALTGDRTIGTPTPTPSR